MSRALFLRRRWLSLHRPAQGAASVRRPVAYAMARAVTFRSSWAQAASRVGVASPRTAAALEGRSFLVPTVRVQRNGDGVIATAVGNGSRERMHARAKNTPIVLDLQLVSSDGSPHARPIKRLELKQELNRLRELGYMPVGVTNASEDIKQIAAKLDLPSMISTRLAPAATSEAESEYADEPTTSTAAAAINSSRTQAAADVSELNAVPAVGVMPPQLVFSSVRSGQQVYAQNRSLIVMGNVNSGAEVLADFDIYVLGALKGRALAGIGGNIQARIVCQSFDAELISIAHHFITCEDLVAQPQYSELRPSKPTTIALDDDQLHFQSTV